jgi:FlaA1/EpsC-like NDP-sugar epimerase
MTVSANHANSLAFGGELPDLHDKVVLITGGTGSFGRACTQRILKDFTPRKVIVLSRDEQKHCSKRLRRNRSRRCLRCS